MSRCCPRPSLDTGTHTGTGLTQPWSVVSVLPTILSLAVLHGRLVCLPHIPGPWLACPCSLIRPRSLYSQMPYMLYVNQTCTGERGVAHHLNQ